MKRTGFKPRTKPIARKSNRVCKATGGAPRPVKPRKRIKSKPLKRSPEWTAYKLANTECELIGMFPSWHEVFDAPDFLWRDEFDEIHHIMHGQAGREDIPTNMICICKPVHNWIHFANGGHANDGRALCLIKKAEKGELDWKALAEISRKQMPGWCDRDSHRPREAWILKQWLELLRTA